MVIGFLRVVAPCNWPIEVTTGQKTMVIGFLRAVSACNWPIGVTTGQNKVSEGYQSHGWVNVVIIIIINTMTIVT